MMRYGKLLCDPSQSGNLLEALQPQNDMTPVAPAVYFTGAKVELLWEPSQKGCLLLWPHEHHQ